MLEHPLNRILITVLAGCLGGFTSQAQLVTGLTPVDVGAPPLPGSTTMNGPGSFTVTGSGEYKNAASDNFQFAYTNVTGNFDYQVRVESLDVPSQWSKVGLMVRETTEATVTADLGSRCVTMAAYPPPPKGGDTFILIRREQTDTPTADQILGTKPTYPNTWLRLRRLGDTIIGFTGTNGVNWDVQGTNDTAAWPEGPLNQNLLLGLAPASAINSSVCTAQCKEFGAVPSTNPVVILAPLKSITVNKGKTAKFSITVGGYDPFSAQWYRNGAPIDGATSYSFGGTLTYTTPALDLGDDNSTFSVVVSNPINTVTNAPVTLRVLDDTVPPAVTAATTDNMQMNVLFSEEVTPDSALNLANYTLNGAGVDIFDVALSSNNRVATMNLSGLVTDTNATVTAARIQDLVGNTGTSSAVPLWPLLPADNIVASGYQDDSRATAFASVTDGFADAGWQTNGDKDHRPQFAGLIYTTVQTFGVIKMDLGQQNEYGGSFAVEPKLYLLRNNVDTSTNGPEADPINWEEVAAPLVSPNLFDANVDPDPSPASPIIFDLSSLAASARAAYGWAIGGVSGDNSGFIRISELRAYGQPGGVIQTTPPSLSVAKGSANSLVISWPTTATGFVLKSTPSLTAPTWSVVADPKTVVGTNVTVTVSSASGTQFYRLEK